MLTIQKTLLLEAIHSAGYSGALANPLLASEGSLNRLNSSILEDFVAVTPRVQDLQFFKLQQESKVIVSSTDEKKGDTSKKTTREKRKSASDIPTNEEPPAKRQKDKVNKAEKSVAQTENPQNESKVKDQTHGKSSKHYTDNCTAFVSNLNLMVDFLFGFYNFIKGF